MEPPPICRGKCSTGQEKQQFAVTPGVLRTPWQFGLSPNCLGSERVDFTTQKKGEQPASVGCSQAKGEYPP